MGRSNKPRTWVTLVADALAELNPLLIPARLEAARQAIQIRAIELGAADPSPEHQAESRALEDALRDLWEHEYKHLH
ncbi:MAG TPA: hypothetical protein VFA89_05895 [Terriglobales bacterium]|nr:hypothetical protein [Terriglobales bacterium]